MKSHRCHRLAWLILIFALPIQARTLVYCAEANPQTFNPQLATDGATFNASSNQIYNRLVQMDNKTMRVVPSLARSWETSPDGKTVTFHLRPGVKFHKTAYFTPTRDFDADDVIFSFDRMRSKKNPFHFIGGGEYPDYEADQMPELIKRIDKVDNLTVRFELTQPESPFLADLAMDFGSILSKEYADNLIRKRKLSDLDSLPVGTGPFIFKSYIKGRAIYYIANPNYFGGRPKFDKLEFLIETDPVKRMRDLTSDICQIDSTFPPQTLAKIRGNPILKVMAAPGLNLSYLAFNVERMPFANLKFREAVYYALNREEYVKEIYSGQAEVAKNPIPPTMWSFDRTTPDYRYDPEMARQLLRKIGIPSGFEITLTCPKVERPYNPDPLKMAKLIKSDLERVGLKVKIRALEWQQFLKKSRAGDLTFSLQGWTGDNGDPDNFLNNLLSCDSISSGNNRAHWCNREFSFLVDRARVTSNVRVRTRFYKKAQKIFHREIPWVPIANNTIFKALRKNVMGYEVSPFGVDYFANVYFK